MNIKQLKKHYPLTYNLILNREVKTLRYKYTLFPTTRAKLKIKKILTKVSYPTVEICESILVGEGWSNDMGCILRHNASGRDIFTNNIVKVGGSCTEFYKDNSMNHTEDQILGGAITVFEEKVDEVERLKREAIPRDTGDAETFFPSKLKTLDL